jgi:hypothetical protein
LPKTLQAARDLEKTAQRGIDEGTPDEAFKSALADARKRMAAQRGGSGQPPFAASASRRELSDLRAELEAARESFGEADGEAQGWQERLAGMTQLKKQLDQQQPGGARELSRSELKALIDKLEQDATGELDRRALLEAEQYLKSMPERDRNRQGEPRPGWSGERDSMAEQRYEKTPGTAPGDAPGEKGERAPAPEVRGSQRAQVKGTIGEGERSATFFKGKPETGKSRLSQDDVVGRYQRQAENELGTERIPEELKDTIRNYFLSLERTK